MHIHAVIHQFCNISVTDVAELLLRIDVNLYISITIIQLNEEKRAIGYRCLILF